MSDKSDRYNMWYEIIAYMGFLDSLSRKICPAKRSRGFSPHLTSPRWGEGMVRGLFLLNLRLKRSI
jgi:hypothetical protein